MTNKLVVIINSLEVPKINRILLYEMKFLVPNYSCLHCPCLGGYRPQIPVFSVLCPQLNLLKPPPQTKFLGTPLYHVKRNIQSVNCYEYKFLRSKIEKLHFACMIYIYIYIFIYLWVFKTLSLSQTT